MNILFVCTGNICRSPVAEHLLRDLVGDGHTVSSAGIAGLTGYAMDPRSVEYLRLRGIDGNDFTARRISRRILEEPDLIIGFEQDHVNECLALQPAAISGTFRLCQLADWQRTGNLASLTDLPAQRRTLPAVNCELEDPVTFQTFDDYFRVLDVIAADVAALAQLLPVEV
ncbi:low molecular weight phosphatase family protein [Corynebacterium sp.]|mgnify:CR=1 FL=1|jgi:protein-tyrosine phosphatase|uniref:low molecular weight phosphatase family protein n=1 Tax=Corynebacterium sp. TaxID=1720 RepID=UPI0025BA278C|nr:low molecular weight phosphatase family protein [Corynebacterium sp.]